MLLAHTAWRPKVLSDTSSFAFNIGALQKANVALGCGVVDSFCLSVINGIAGEP